MTKLLTSLAASILIAGAMLASAQDKPKEDADKKFTIDFNQQLRGFDGKVLIEGEKGKEVALTLKMIVLGALNVTIPSEANESLTTSYERGELIRRIQVESKFPVDSAERQLILDHISEAKINGQPLYTVLVKRIVPPLIDPVKYKP